MRASIAVLFCIAVLGAGVVHAQDDDTAQYEVILYGWGMAAGGDLATTRGSTDFDLSFSDILKDLNGAVMGAAQARWGRWIAQFDGLYSQLEDDTGNKTFHLHPGPGPGVDVAIRAKAKLDLAYADLKGGYTLIEGRIPDQPASDPRRWGIDFVMGARWWYIAPDIDLRVGPLAANGSSSEHWVDALVGLQARVDLTPRLRLAAAGDIGGFSIGSASDRTWKAGALLRWQVNDSWSAYLAYRALYIEHPIGDNDLELRFRGPLVGVGYQF